MRFLSLFSGIEAASCAWSDLGWECVGFSEIEPFPCDLLAQRHPGVPNLGDITEITEADILGLGQIDLVVFGSPCQDLSVAGNQKGLDGARSGLFFTALRIVQWARTWGDCRFALWENVPGAFSSNSGRDFARVVDALAGVAGTAVPPKGWGTEGCAVGPQAMVEWATLDAQWFGVAQRRRRVFALADFGDWSGRPPILLESDRLRGDTAPCREAWQGVTGTLSARTKGGGGLGTDFDLAGGIIPERRPVLTQDVCPTLRAGGNKTGGDRPAGTDVDTADSPTVMSSTGDVSHCLNAGGMGRIDYETETFVLQPEAYQVCFNDANGSRPDRPNGGAYIFKTDFAGALTRGPSDLKIVQPVAYSTKLHNTTNNQAGKVYAEYSTALDRSSPPPVLLSPMAVRRLTPTECERLQGFPDGHTAVLHRGKPAADSNRYKSLGNSMAVPVMAWIGRQIDFAVRFF